MANVRTTRVFSITMPPGLARQAERLAKKENRTMSELVREALRSYREPPLPAHIRELVDRIAPAPPALRAMWEEAKAKGLDKMTMAEIDREVQAVRKQRRKRSRIHEE